MVYSLHAEELKAIAWTYDLLHTHTHTRKAKGMVDGALQWTRNRDPNTETIEEN